MQVVDCAVATIARLRQPPARPLWRSYQLAIEWLLANRLQGSGITVSSDHQAPYPEVTGYLIPTLRECGETDLAVDLARWLISIQRPDGGFAGPDDEDESYLFDTGQVMRGFLAVLDLLPECRQPLQAAGDFLIRGGQEPLIVRPRAESRWTRRYGHRISENIHIYALTPLAEAAQTLCRQDFREAVERSLNYYVSKPDLLEFSFLTHFYGYVLEGLVDLGRGDLARKGLAPVIAAQRPDGAIPGVPEAEWVCSPGSLQMAIVGYKLGLIDFGNAAVDSMQPLQQPTGGFRGSYGPGAAYGPDAEPSWACKYFLDACHWRMRTTFARQRDRFQAEVPETDVRRGPVIEALGDLDSRSVLEVGCGKGRFLRLLEQRYPGADLSGVDVAEELLEYLPERVHGKVGSMLNLPFPAGTFDVVLCIEALEHAVRIDRAISEMSRVLKPAGRLVIVDKSIEHLGRLRIEPWEQWFDPPALAALMESHGFRTTVSGFNVSRDDPTAALRVWQGIRTNDHVAHLPSTRDTRAGRSQTRTTLQYRRARRRAHARVLAEQAFARYADGDVLAARKLLLRTLALELPAWVTNRGVLSILVESFVGQALMRTIRGALHSR